MPVCEEVFTTLTYKGNKLITSLLIRLFFNSLVLSGDGLAPGAVWQCLETLFGCHGLGVLQASPEQLPEMFQTTSQSTG